MTKNRTMRVAVLLLALTLITSCFVGGTFAKYITKDEGTDSARVAKWGIELSVTGDEDTFVTAYDGTVESQTTEDLVAPGTKNDTGVTFTVDGNPEVATEVSVSLGNTQDVFLKYDANGDDADGKEATYNPVVFTLTHTYGADAYSIAPAVTGTEATVVTEDGKDVVTGTLAQIESVLANLTASMTQVNPGYTYDDTFTLTWAWDFETGNDNLDTILGDLAAGIAVDGYTADDYNLTVAYDFAITVEQVD